MKKLINTLEEFNQTKVIKNSLQVTKLKYRPLDPGSYLYDLILKYKYKNKFTEDFIKLVYVTLSAWNMNSRGAKLNDYKVFKSSIIKNKKYFDILQKEKIHHLNREQNIEALSMLFNKIRLVYLDKPPLVTFSKTMHFFLPDLIVPIDRKYTLNYFYKNITIPKDNDKQFKMFIEIQEEYSLFANEHDLSKYIDSIWNRNIPKIMDNMVIGYLKGKEKRRTTAST